LKSLDPRVTRLPDIEVDEIIKPKMPLDQFGTFEVFVEPKEGKPFQHEGIVHAPNLEMAYVLAKETFTRRFTCSSLYVTETRDVYVSPLTEGDQNAYDSIPEVTDDAGYKTSFEIYHLVKRGKQHVHAGSVAASNPLSAMAIAKTTLNTGKIVYNVWAIRTDKIRFTTTEEKDLWITLPEKKFRDASEYKGGDKLKNFLEKTN
jgi:ring-1,2-phenylacetyl-CoA epoxidase subunit PaaB